MNNIYYVYEHVRLDTSEVFYVGKGKHNRATSHKNRNKHWHNIVQSCGYTHRIVIENIDEELAFLVEQELILKHRLLNRKLANYTNGGEGFSGCKHDESAKKKMSDKARGRTPHNKGRSASEETRKKMSLAKIGKPPGNKGNTRSQETREKMSKAKIGAFYDYKWWNNGTKSTRAKECPGDGWILGRIRGSI